MSILLGMKKYKEIAGFSFGMKSLFGMSPVHQTAPQIVLPLTEPAPLIITGTLIATIPKEWGDNDGQFSDNYAIAATENIIMVTDRGKNICNVFTPIGDYLSHFGINYTEMLNVCCNSSFIFINDGSGHKILKYDFNFVLLDEIAFPDDYVMDVVADENNLYVLSDPSGVCIYDIETFNFVKQFPGEMTYPTALWVDADAVWILDNELNVTPPPGWEWAWIGFRRVLKYSLSGDFLSAFGEGLYGAEETQLLWPYSLCSDDQSIFVADYPLGKVACYDKTTFSHMFNISPPNGSWHPLDLWIDRATRHLFVTGYNSGWNPCIWIFS